MSASNTRRRLSLLSGSALIAALATAGAGGIALAPTAALAANECGDPTTNGATADTFQCTGTHGSIVYTATSGNLTLQLQAPVTVSGGISVTPTGTNSVSITRTTDVTVGAGDPQIANSAGAGINIERATGGTITVNLTDNDTDDAPLLSVSGTTAGIRVRNAGTSASTVTTTNGAITASAGAGVDLGTIGTGGLTFNNGATVRGTTAAVLVASGNNATITNNATGLLDGLVTMNNTGNATLNNNGVWRAAGTSVLGSGNSTLNNNITGTLAVGGATETASTLILSGLETWNNAGRVLFGAVADISGSDGVGNDRIASAGTLFTGSTESALVMDVDLSASQTSCAAAVTADCLDLRGSSTAGSTSILVNTVGGGLDAAAGRIVLVDVEGVGTSAAEHFTLDEDSAGYRVVGSTGVLDQGLVFYTLDYDETAQQHVLAAALNGSALEIARISRTASEPWRTATGMWQDRQLDMREAFADQGGAGVWLKLAGAITNDKRESSFEFDGGQLAYNTNSQQRTTAVVGGVDLVRMFSGDSAWVAGVTAGKLDSRLTYRAGASELELDGHSFGAYASLVSGRLFVDAIVNATSLDLTHGDFGQTFEGSAKSIGYQFEAGYRVVQVNDGGAYIEPIAALSYVRTEVDDMAFGAVEAAFEDAASLRAALGLRVAGDVAMETLTARLSVTGRLWEELDGEHAVTLDAPFGSSTLIDTDLDALGDVGVAIGLFAPGGRMSANLGYSLKFGDSYQSSDASLNVRFSW